jgi:hypothetical protein
VILSPSPNLKQDQAPVITPANESNNEQYGRTGRQNGSTPVEHVADFTISDDWSSESSLSSSNAETEDWMDFPEEGEVKESLLKDKPAPTLRKSAVRGSITTTTRNPVVDGGVTVPNSLADRHRFAKFVPTEEQEAAFILLVMNKEDLGLLKFRKEKSKKQCTDGQK